MDLNMRSYCTYKNYHVHILSTILEIEKNPAVHKKIIN